MKKAITLILIIFMISGCAALRDFADVQRPTASFSNMSIQNISFDSATLLFNFDVNNPNRFGINAEQYSYDLLINEHSFLSGTQTENLRISRETTSTVQVPVTIRFSDLLNSFSSLAGSDSFAYSLSTEIQFDVPGLGRQRLPANAAGELPIPRVPQVEFGGFDVKNLSLSGAEMEVAFRVHNPNRFGISMSNAAYALQVNGREWLDTRLGDTIRLDASGSDTIRIPIRLNATQMGSVLVEMMRGSTEFDYNVTGSADLSADIDGFDDGQTIPFDLSGRYSMD